MNLFITGILLSIVSLSAEPQDFCAGLDSGNLPAFESPECPASGPAPVTVDLTAGKNFDAGDVEISIDGTSLTIGVTPEDPWCITEIHYHAAFAEDFESCIEKIPATNKENLRPGRFEYAEYRPHGGEICSTDAPYEVNAVLDEEYDPATDVVCVAFHAVVENADTGSEETAWAFGENVGRNWAMVVEIKASEGGDCIFPGNSDDGKTGAAVRLRDPRVQSPGADNFYAGGGDLGKQACRDGGSKPRVRYSYGGAMPFSFQHDPTVSSSAPDWLASIGALDASDSPLTYDRSAALEDFNPDTCGYAGPDVWNAVKIVLANRNSVSAGIMCVSDVEITLGDTSYQLGDWCVQGNGGFQVKTFLACDFDFTSDTAVVTGNFHLCGDSNSDFDKDENDKFEVGLFKDLRCDGPVRGF